MKVVPALVLALLLGAFSATANAQEDMAAAETWLPSLITATPQEGFALAVTLSRKGVGTTQPDKKVLGKLRPEYANDPDSLIAVSHVIAVHFQTIAAANDYWRSE